MTEYYKFRRLNILMKTITTYEDGKFRSRPDIIVMIWIME